MKLRQSKQDLLVKATPFIVLIVSLFLAYMIWKGYIKTLDTPLGIIREGSAPFATAFVVAVLVIATGLIIRKGFYLIVTILMLASCSPRYCQPSRKSADYAWKVKKVSKEGPPYEVKLIRFERGVRVLWPVMFQCLPDSIKEGRYVSQSDLKNAL